MNFYKKHLSKKKILKKHRRSKNNVFPFRQILYFIDFNYSGEFVKQT